MNKLKLSVTITSILGLLAVFALFFLCLALSDIAKNEVDQRIEWYTAGICIMILGAFTISTFITIGYLVKHVNFSEKPG